jgi:NTE family protein
MMRTRLRWSAAPLLAFFVCATAAPAQTTASSGALEPPRRPKIGLALGGGGARGDAHIGVLEVLERLRIPIDYIAGTSMGSVVGGLYAVGYSPEKLNDVVDKVDWANLFVDSAPRADTAFRRKENDYYVPPGITLGIKKNGVVLPAGLIAGRKLSFLLNTLTLPVANISNFNDLSIPFRAVATDARTGLPVVLSEGVLSRSIRASMAIPIIFTPVQIGDYLLIDGGEAENLPVQTVRAMGADIVIAVDVASSSEVPKEAPSSISEMLGRLIDLPLLRNTMESRKLADVVITPDLSGFSSADFAKSKQIVPKGLEAANAAADKLSKYSVSEEEYRAWQKTHRVPLPEHPPIIDAVVVDPVPRFDTRRISRVIATKAGLPFNQSVLDADMRRIAAMGLFQDVEFRFVREDGRNVLHIIATPKPWGPTYLTAGISFEISDADASFDLGLLLDATEVNRMGADWKTNLRLGNQIAIGSAFYQPLDYAGRFYVSPKLAWSQEPVDIFVEGERVAQYRVRQGGGSLDFGVELGHLLQLGQFSVGIERAAGTLTRRTGTPEFPDVDIDLGNFHSQLRLDQLDSVWFPTKGYFVDAQFIGSRTGLGATDSFNRGQLLAFGAKTFGRWTVVTRVSYGDGFGQVLPFYELFPLGGFLNLSGYSPGELHGSTFAFGAFTARYRLTKTPGAVIKGLYAGFSIEGGNTWQFRDQASISDMHLAGSIYVVADTLVGPLFLAYGNSGAQNQAVYLFLNQRF